MATITYSQLVKLRACPEREKFKEIFGEVMNVTPEIAMQYANVLASNWAILHVMTKPQLTEYARRVHNSIQVYRPPTKEALNRLRAKIAAEVYCGLQ